MNEYARKVEFTSELFYQNNIDFPGDREVKDDLEKISYRKDSTVRFWYNDIPAPFAPHRHVALEIIIPIENWYKVSSQTETFVVQPGEVLIIPPNEVHRLEAPSSGKRFVYLVDISDMTQMQGFAGIRPLLTRFIHITSETYPRVYNEVMKLLTEMRESYFSSRDFYELTIHANMFKLFVVLGQDHLKSTNAFTGLSEITRKEYMHRFNDVLNYINERYADDLSLEHVAEHCGFSKFHFSRLFKKYTNTTFYDYLTYKRIQAAEELLADADLTITEVALRTGFPSISTFNRTFKRRKNCAPREYRTLCRKN